MLERAYSVLTVKSLDAARRVFTGIATTPKADRHGDSINPFGLTYAQRIPLLLHHDPTRPIGWVTLQPATADGIAFEAEIPIVEKAGAVKDRTDEAWDSITSRLITGLSVGLANVKRAIARASEIAQIAAAEICEISLVTIPSNTDATILTIKALDAPHLPAIGLIRSGGSDPVSLRVAPMKNTITSHITALENKRAATDARMLEIMTAANEAGTTLDDDAATEYESLGLQLKTVDRDLVFARDLEKSQLAAATRVALPASVTTVTRTAGPISVSVKPNVPPGTAFVRAACATLVCKGNRYEAAEYAKRWDDSTPEVALYLKAAVAPGTTTDATWAGPLVNANIANDFIALLRPATILGKIPGLRTVPFNTKVPTQTAGGTYGWVGESKPKPVTKLAFGTTSLGYSKAAGIIVLTEELVRLSNPSAEDLVRGDMIAGIAQFLDLQFIDPAVAAVAGINPASITNGAPTAVATTNPLADILGLIQHFASNNISVDGVTFIMSAANALSLSFRTNLDGSPLFPGIGIGGGNYRGLTFVTSQAAGANVIALQPSLILYADDGQVSIDASREASLQMDSAPASPADATTVYVSLWQTNNVGLRAERWVNWAKANANAVKYLTAAAYPSPAGASTQSVEGSGSSDYAR